MTPPLEHAMWHDVLALNRLTRLLVVAALVISVVVVARWAANQPRFAIRAISVVGVDNRPVEHVRAEQVAQYSVPRISGTIFTNDLEATRNAFEALPWVRRASVRRQWPDRLLVTIEEHRALARWNDDAGNRFVSVLGEAFNAPGETALAATLPLLLGPEGTEREVARRLKEFAERLSPIGRTPSVVALSPRQAWTIRLAHTGEGASGAAKATREELLLDLGREQPRSSVLSRLERFVTHYSTTLGRMTSRAEAVDLRYPNGFAVRIPGFHAHQLPAGKATRSPRATAPRPVTRTAAPIPPTR